MKPREVVEAVFRFEPTESVPYWVPMEESYEAELDAFHGGPDWREQIVPYVYGGLRGFKWKDLGDGTWLDPFGVVFRKGNITHVERKPLEAPSLKGYDWPSVESLEDWDQVADDFRRREGTFRWCGLGLGLYERAWHLRGMEALLMDMAENPGFVEELLDGVLEIHKQAVSYIAKTIPCEAYFGGDDWSGQTGPMMGMALWRQYFKPRIQELIDFCHEQGLPFVCHSCGNVSPMFEDLVEIGLDGLESLQPEAMDIYDLKRRATGKCVLVGGLGAQSTLSFGTPEDVRRETEKLLREMSRGSGYIAAPAKPFMHGFPPANAMAFIETVTQMEAAAAAAR